MHNKIVLIRNYLIVSFCCLLVAGAIFSRALLSISMISLIVLFLANPNLKQDLKLFIKDKSLLAITAIFLVYAFSGLYSTDMDYLAERLRIKLPFLAIPLSLVSIRSLPNKMLNWVIHFAFYFISAIAGFIMVNYFINFSTITESILHGNAIPSPIHHIHLSIFVVFTILTGAFIINKKIYLFSKKESYLIVAIIIFLVAFLHIFAVRTGLLSLYTVLLYLIIHELRKGKNRKFAIAGLALIIILPVSAYFSVNSFRNKIDYTVEDLEMFIKEDYYKDYSDGNRLVSMKAGFIIGNQSPLIGVGAGDLVNELSNLYQERYPEVKDFNLLPHNQLIQAYAATGILGVAIILLALILPIVTKSIRQDWYLVSMSIVIYVGIMVEPLFENQIGVALYTFYIPFLINYYQKVSE